MFADHQSTPTAQGRRLLAAGFLGAAAGIIVLLLLPLPGAWQAAAYLILLSTLPGGALLTIADQRATNPLLTLAASVMISIAIVMATSLTMAYLDAWLPKVVILSTALLSAVAGTIEFRRVDRAGKGGTVSGANY